MKPSLIPDIFLSRENDAAKSQYPVWSLKAETQDTGRSLVQLVASGWKCNKKYVLLTWFNTFVKSSCWQEMAI